MASTLQGAGSGPGFQLSSLCYTQDALPSAAWANVVPHMFLALEPK